MPISEARKRATKNYEKSHPERLAYTTARRKAFNFLNASEKSKVGQAIKLYKSEYIDDLKDLQETITIKLNQLTGKE